MHSASPRHLWRTLAALLLSALIVLSGCSSAGETSEDEDDTSTQDDPSVAQTEDEPTGAPEGDGFVQDLWVYEKVAVLDADGDEIDLTADIVSWLEGQDLDDTTTLADGLDFHRYDALSPELVRRGALRDDVTMTAGLIESDAGAAIAVLATPDEPTSDPIGFEDRIRVDLSFLGDRLASGDPLIVDHTFLQAFHTTGAGGSAESSSALELFSERADAGEIRYLGTADGDQQIYTGEIGMVLDPSSPVGGGADGDLEGVRSWSSLQSGDPIYKGEMPAKAQPMLDGLERGIRKCGMGRGFGTACVRRYMKSMEAGSRDSMNLIDCNLSPSAENCDIDPEPEPEPDPEPEPPAPTTTTPRGPTPGGPGNGGSGSGDGRTCAPPCGRVVGEPHLETFDGSHYNMQGVGEFVATRSDELEVQVRTEPFRSAASAIAAVAMSTDGHQIMISSGSVTVDGEQISESALEDPVQIGEAVLTRTGATVAVTTEDGDLVQVTDTTAWLDLWISLADADADRVGLLGDVDGDPSNDLRTADGTVMEQPLGFEDLYDVFAESWRVTDGSSLFHYDDGEDTSTFTDRDFPAAPLTLESLPAADRAWAERLCRAAGIEDAKAFEECVIDLAVTGDLAALRSSRRVDTIAGISSGRFDDTGASPADRASYESDGSADEPDDDVPVPSGDTPPWQMTARQLREGDEDHSRMTCPAGGSAHVVWGSDVYSDDSSVCTAAVHLGIITFEEGGEVLIDHLPGRDGYEGKRRNGVASGSWGSWSGSFAFVGPTGRHIPGS